MSLVIEQSILGFYLNPDVRLLFKGHIHPWMFQSGWAGQFVVCLNQPAYDGVVPDVQEFIVDLHNKFGVHPKDCEYAAQVLVDYKVPRSLEKITNHLQEWVKEAYLSSGVETIAAGNDREYKQKGLDSIAYGINFQVGLDAFMDFSDLDVVEQARAEDLPPDGRIIKSSFSVINNASTYKGYKYGDLTMVAAESGVGKSTWLVTECANFLAQGFKVAHLLLGDLSNYDVLLKYVANLNDVEIEEILQAGHESYLTPGIRGILSNLRVKVLPPDTYDIYQIIAKAAQLYQKFPFDALVVDYDGNIKDVNAGASSYIEGGAIYANLKGYGTGRCACFIASQTKINFWGEEIVLKNYANDSSKKQHHLDYMIGLGPNKECKTIGTLNLAKVRRGITDRRVRVKFENGKGKVVEIRQDAYDRILQAHKLNSSQFSYDYESLMSS